MQKSRDEGGVGRGDGGRREGERGRDGMNGRGGGGGGGGGHCMDAHPGKGREGHVTRTEPESVPPGGRLFVGLASGGAATVGGGFSGG